MNINDAISNSKIKHHLIVESLLLLIIVFLLIKCSGTITIDPKGFAENNVVNFSLLKNGSVVKTDRKGNIISVSEVKELPPNYKPLKQIHGIAIAVTRTTDNKSIGVASLGIIDSIISPAMAREHQIAGHIYDQITFNIDNTLSCERYDVTDDWEFVGECIGS
jgi:hypothetical protein